MTDCGTTDCGVSAVGVHGRLEGITLDAPAGEITALVGGNGAGKTTLLHLFVGAIAPDTGTVTRPGADRIGYVPTGSGYYPDLTVGENIDFVAEVYGIERSTLAARRDSLLDHVELTPFVDRLAGRLSGGMRQKLALAMGTLHRPQLLVLDEPTTGIDPVSRAELWRLMAEEAASKVHVLLATSYLDEAERASHVLALHRGATLLEGRPEDLAASVPGTVSVVDSPTDRRWAWRQGTRWRQWTPPGDDPVPGERVQPSLEDAVIVATLRREDQEAQEEHEKVSGS